MANRKLSYKLSQNRTKGKKLSKKDSRTLYEQAERRNKKRKKIIQKTRSK